jgi:thymidylate synthase (FAD)
MEFTNFHVDYIPQQDLLKHIELCGRVCYKSEHRINEESARKFLKMIYEKGHLSVFEHGTVYLKLNTFDYIPMQGEKSLLEILTYNKYSKSNYIDGVFHITTNMRVLLENFDKNILEVIFDKFVCEPTDFHEKRYTFKVTQGIDISRENNRHRVNSISEESTRYCNYNKKGINFCCSSDGEFVKGELEKYDTDFKTLLKKVLDDEVLSNLDNWMLSCMVTEFVYNNLINNGIPPQIARKKLTLDTKTETYYTAFVSDWEHYLGLRLASGAHPDARYIAEQIERFINVQK